MQDAVGEHFDFIKLLNFSSILLVLCKYFDFIPTYVLFCMCPLPPPPVSVCSNCMCYSLFLDFAVCGIFSEHFRRDFFGKFLDFFFYLLDFREHYDNIVSGQHVPTPV